MNGEYFSSRSGLGTVGMLFAAFFFIPEKPLLGKGLGAANNGAPDTIRTYDLQFRKLLLYPAELRAHIE